MKCKECINCKIIGAGEPYCLFYKKDVKRYVGMPKWCVAFKRVDTNDDKY